MDFHSFRCKQNLEQQMSVLESILGTDAIYNDTVEVVGDDVPETNVDDREV